MRIIEVVYKKLGRNRANGMADEGKIYIDPRVKGRKELEMFNHEGLHILAPYLTEEAVTSIAAELTRVQWEAGFRKIDQDCSQPLQDEHDPK